MKIEKNHLILKKLSFLFFIFLFSCSNSIKNDCSFLEYCIFNGTSVQEVAALLEQRKFEEVKYLVKKNKININTSEPKYGLSLLMVSVSKRDYKVTKLLLELGANPNQHDSNDGSSPIIIAAALENYPEESTQFLELLLKHGGNPNDEEIGPRQEGNTTRKKPLLEACSDVNERSTPLRKVQLLVNAGANINYINEFGHFALRQALFMEHYDVVLYLLKNGAKHDMIIVDRSKFQKDGKKIYLLDFLNEQSLLKTDKKFQQRQLIYEFLKNEN